MKNEKFILDATAGYRMMWYNKNHPNALYLDQRSECEPDIVTPFYNLSQIPDESKNLIIFDPPHLLEKNGIPPDIAMCRKFGALNAETWQDEIKKAFSEFFRCLKPRGILIFKWCDARLPSHKLIKLSPYPPIVYQVSSVRHKKGSKSGSDEIRTLWFCFMKIPEMRVGGKNTK